MRGICRVLFSRYAISAIAILLEVTILSLLMVFASKSLVIIIATSLVLSLLAFLNLINKDANPEYKVTWAAIILIVLPFGAILYFMFYERRMSGKEAKILKGAISELAVHGNEESRDNMRELSLMDLQAFGKARAIMTDDPLADLYSASSSKFFAEGEDFFSALLSDIEAAKKYIFLEYFIIDEGELWDAIHALLRKKAAEGLDVRLLYDDIGCMKTLPSRYEKQLIKEGIKTFRFARVSPRVSSVHHNRDHRKICVVDGTVGYTGGVNIADEYVNIKERFGHWKDGGIRVEGCAVAGLVKLFLSAWDFTSATVSDYKAFLSEVKPASEPDGGYYLPFGSGPAPIYKRPAGKNAFLNIINQAKNYVYITTPYLIIDYDLTESLRNAALRGVEVRIITPGIADKKFIKVLTKSSYPYLIEAGVKISEYTPGFIHEKTVICDDEIAVIGTINFDFRSLVHHFENAFWLYKTPSVLDAKHEYLKTLSECTDITPESAKLTFKEKLVRTGIKIFAPLF